MFGVNNQIQLKAIILSSIFVVFMTLSVKATLAQTEPVQQNNVTKDTDLDGIPDKIEAEKYKTNPLKEDTDGDGVLDAQEIIDGTNPNDKNSLPVNNSIPLNRALLLRTDPIPWYVARAAGIGAFIMFSIVVIEGLLMTTKLHLKFRKIVPPSDVLEFHAFFATFIGLGLLVLHIISLMYDQFMLLKPHEIFVPFLLKRDFSSVMGFSFTFTVALGIIALYLSILLVFTSRYRGKLINTKLWRKLHYLSFLFYILFIIHGFTSGSDSNALWMQVLYVGSILIVVVLIIIRIFFTKKIVRQNQKTVIQTSSNTVQTANADMKT